MTRTRLTLINAWRLRGRYTVLLLVLLLGSGLVAAGATLGAYADDGARKGVDEAGALRRIDVYGDGGGGPLTAARVEALRARSGAQAVEPVLQAAVGLEATRTLVTLTNIRAGSSPPVLSGAFPAPGTRGLVLPAAADGQDLSGLVGTTAAVSYTVGISNIAGRQMTVELPVVGTYDPSWQVDGPAAAYVPLDLVRDVAAARAGVDAAKFGELVGYDRVEVLADTVEAVPNLTAAIQADGYHAVSVQQGLAQVPGVIALIRLVTGALFVVLLLLAVVTAVGMSSSLARQRVRETAVLRTMGWPSSAIIRVLLGEVTVVAAVACMSGTAVGVGAALLAAGELRARPLFAEALAAPSPPSLVLLTLGIAGAVAVVAIGAAQPLVRVARSDIVTTLREL